MFKIAYLIPISLSILFIITCIFFDYLEKHNSKRLELIANVLIKLFIPNK